VALRAVTHSSMNAAYASREGEVAYPAQPQPLIQCVLQVPVGRLDIAVLMGVAGKIA
jgi:hypothetical protein